MSHGFGGHALTQRHTEVLHMKGARTVRTGHAGTDCEPDKISIHLSPFNRLIDKRETNDVKTKSLSAEISI